MTSAGDAATLAETRRGRGFAMGTQSIFGRVIAGCTGLLLMGALLTPAGPAGAAGPTAITVTPSSGLVDLDLVTITGTGFTPNSTVGFCEGVFGGLTLDYCGVIFSTTLSGNTGNVTLTVPVHQLLRVPALGRVADCRADACGIAAADLDGVVPVPGSIATFPISFAPAPTPPASKGAITVTPDIDLNDFTAVDVVGSGFRPNARVETLVCGSGAPANQGDCALEGQATTDATGAFETSFLPTSPTPGGVDCRAVEGACSVAVGEAADVAGTIVSHPVSFRPANRFPGVLSISPSVGLVDGQPVTVDGNIFDPNQQVAVCQFTYPFEGTDTCGSNVAIATTDQFGTFQIPYTVRRTVSDSDGDHDCLVVKCVIAAVEGFASPANLAQANLSFVIQQPTVVPAATASPPAEGDSGTTTVEVPVHLSAPSPATVTVPWRTLFVPGAPAGQADPGTDYVAASGTATFLPGQTDTTVTIVVNGDLLVEPDEYIVVSFDHPTHAVMGGFWGLGFGIIGNDDP